MNNKERKNRWSLLVKPTNDCNLNCKYCYDLPMREKHGATIMPFEMIEHIGKLTSDYAAEVSWIWHGGEPTLMGTEWYKQAQEKIWSNYRTLYQFQMQSNGLLLDEEWADFSEDYKTDIGMSFDVFSQQDVRIGAKENKDYIDKIKLFNNRNLSLGTISVITAENMDRQIELYEYYKRQGLSAPAFNHIYRSGGSVAHGLEPEANDFVDAYDAYFKYWLKDSSEKSLAERSIIEGLEVVTGGNELCCTFSDCRLNWVGVNADGGVYPCDRHVPDRYYMGNIMNAKSVDELYDTEGFKNYYDDVEKRFNGACKECGYLDYCGGLCNANHIAVSGSADGIDEFSCELFKGKMRVVYNAMRDIDLYKGEHNITFLKKAIEHPFFNTREIITFLHKAGYPVNNLIDGDDVDLLERRDFKLFSVFNAFKRAKSSNPGHVNYRTVQYEYSINLKENRNLRLIKQGREEAMLQLLKENKEDIEKIVFSKHLRKGAV